jgi:hypothetical protein
LGSEPWHCSGRRALSKRIDQSYFEKAHPWRRTRNTLVFLCSTAAGRDIKPWNLLGSRCGQGWNRIADTRRILKLEKEG